MISNPYYSEARAVPQSYGAYMGAAMPGAAMPIMAPGMNTPPGIPGGTFPPSISPGAVAQPGGLPMEESYIENILRLNLGKAATIYMTYENNSEWNAKIFKGIVEAAGRDHIIISDPQTGMRYLLLMVNLDYITFDEELKYSYPTRTHSYIFG
ncbi:MAG: spore coat protein GerQ [Paenibacillaceae bacterium]